MKKLCIIILVIFTASFTFANPIITLTAANGIWKNTSAWDLHRVPKDGDTVVIPPGKTVTINDVQDLSNAFLYVEVYGTLKFSGGKLWVNVNSTIVVYSGGSITGTGNSSETLRINGVDKYWGHFDSTIPGPAYASKTTGTSPIGFNFGFVTLPVKFIGFSLSRQNNNVIVEWATAQEINSSYFEVQRSENGNEWNTIAKVTAAGNTTLAHSYSYTDKNISAPVVYYRIRQVDIDGNFSITSVCMLKNGNDNAEVSANVTSNSIYLHFTDQVRTNVIVRLISMSGQTISQKILNEPVGQVILPVENEMKGIYVVTITDGQSIKFSKQILL